MTENTGVLTNYARSTLFWMLFGFVLLLAVFFVSDYLTVLTATPEQLNKYPFGPESLYPYTSKETYLFNSLIWALVNLASLIIAAIALHLKHNRLALVIIASPLLLNFFSMFLMFR